MHTALIDYFKKGLVDKDKTVDFAAINKKAVKMGYLISPECCNKYVDEWLDTLTANYNATFYKEWNDVLSKSRFELFIDQLRHYASTYGADFKQEGNGWVPNDGGLCPRFEDLKVIEPIAADELAMKCLEVLKSGIALKDSTMKVMCDFYIATIPWKADDNTKVMLPKMLSEVKNKEAMCYLSQKFKVLPADEFGMLRCIAFAYTGRMELIKSRATVATIKSKANEVGFRSPLLDLTDEQVKRLSRIFLRYKPIFLAMKGNGPEQKLSKVRSVVNRLRRLAVENHRPFKIGFWENIIKTEQPIEEVQKRLADLDNFRKIRLMMLCKERMNFKTTSGVFTIRNGKQFVRESYSPKYDRNWLSRLYFTIEASLVESLKAKACKVRLPEYYDIALPTSEKNFVGNFPYGSSFGFTKNNVIGVYWRNEWGTRDFDLSYADLQGNYYGWAGRYNNGDKTIVYSGDMTCASPEAVELLYATDAVPDGIVRLNKYCGDDKSQFRLFFANECLDGKITRGYMVNPNNIKFDTMMDFDGQGQKNVGIVLDNRFYLMDMTSGKGRVASGKYANIIVDAMKKKAKSFIDLKEVLFRAGFEIVEKDSETKPDIDFTNLEKDTLINLLSK